jgi:hypothetical protein
MVQKPKLKVGKTKPKADNFTDTSFKAKCEAIENNPKTTLGFFHPAIFERLTDSHQPSF